ncbi:PTS system glucose-specific enzyme II, ABC component [Atlantibacter hermannii]|nr:PTS system glucose-specific enzyme II, ABC component [Atlantibacter hermannii]
MFANLSVLFAVGVAVGLAKNDKGTAGLAALLAFLVMNATINALLTLTGKLAQENPGAVGQGMTLGIQTLETGVFGGVVIGLVTCALHSRFNKIALPQFLGFFWRVAFCPYHQFTGGYPGRRANDRDMAPFPETHFWIGRAG